MTAKKSDKTTIKELKAELKEEIDKGKRIADHNTLLMNQNKKAKIDDSIQTIIYKLSGVAMFVSGFMLPDNKNPSFTWHGDKSETKFPLLALLGVIIVFWPQIKKNFPIFMRAVNPWKK